MAQVDAEVLDHLKMVLGLVEGAGATVEEACPDLANLERTYFTLRGMDMAITARNMPEEVKRHFKQTLIDNMAFGRSMSVDDVADAHLNRTVIFNKWSNSSPATMCWPARLSAACRIRRPRNGSRLSAARN